MSLGNRSGVHWIRENFPSTASVKTFAAVVLASPGTDSSNICPLASKQTKREVCKFFCPTILSS